MSLTHLVQEKTEKSENDNWANFESSSLLDPDMKNKSTAGVTSSETKLQFTAETVSLWSSLNHFS